MNSLIRDVDNEYELIYEVLRKKYNFYCKDNKENKYILNTYSLEKIDLNKIDELLKENLDFDVNVLGDRNLYWLEEALTRNKECKDVVIENELIICRDEVNFSASLYCLEYLKYYIYNKFLFCISTEERYRYSLYTLTKGGYLKCINEISQLKEKDKSNKLVQVWMSLSN